MTELYLSKNSDEREINLKVILPLKAVLQNSKYGADVEIKPHTNRRTTQQNNYMFLNFQEVASVLNKAGCSYGCFHLKYTAELVHDITKQVLGKTTTTQMSTSEFSDYIEQIFAFWIDMTKGKFIPKETYTSYLERTGLV